jgi:hypothetical protein
VTSVTQEPGTDGRGDADAGRAGADGADAGAGRAVMARPDAATECYELPVTALSASTWPSPYHELWPGPPWHSWTAPLLTPVNPR